MLYQNTGVVPGTYELPSAREWPRPLLAGLLIGALLGMALTLLAWKGLPAVLTPDEPVVAARSWPARPLPPEWQWSPPGVQFEHMFPKRGR